MTRIFTSLVLSLPLIGAYGIFAIGIVLIYRASRMLNLAHGAMAMLPAYVLYAMVQAGIPVAIAFPLGIAGGALLGLAVERILVSRLRTDGPTAQTVGTVAALGLIVAVAARVWGTSSRPAVRIFPAGRIDVGLSNIQYGEIGLLVVMLAVAGGLTLVLVKTDLGLMMRGSAESALAASLMGVNPARIISFTWMLGGALAALAGILLGAVTSLHPYTLTLQVLPAFIAALIGGLGSLPGALVGSAIVGGTQGLVPALGEIGRTQGAPQLFLAILAVVAMVVRGRKGGASDDGRGAVTSAPDRKKVAANVAGQRVRLSERPVRTSIVVAAIVLFRVMPGVGSSMVATANLAAIYAVIAVALVILTGWVGQISLGHAALVGVGAYVTGHAVAGLGIAFPYSLPIAAAAAGVAAALLGAVALRVRGLYLAVATLVFSWTASEFLFRQEWFTQHDQVQGHVIGRPGAIPFFDFTDRRTFFLVTVAVLALVVFIAANVRDSKTGRAFFAIRGSEVAAASLGIDVMRYKLLAFVVSGAVAGAAGNLIMTDARVVTADQFTFNVSLFFVSIAVVGGLTSLGGAIAGGVLFAGLSELFYQVSSLGAFLEIISNLLLAVTLVAYRGGLASLSGRLDRVGRLVAERVQPVLRRLPDLRRVAAPPPVSLPVPRLGALMSRLPRRTKVERPVRDAPLDLSPALAPAVSSNGNGNGDHAPVEIAPDPAAVALTRAAISAVRPEGPREDRTPLIEAEHVTVRFGGLVAVNDASLRVHEGEIVGLIGPNGAGKTTMFNAVAGYNSPAEGTIRLYGVDVTELPVHQRAELGVARTFQLVQLFRELTVFENLLVATHVHNPTGFGSHLFASGRSLEHELSSVDRVAQVLELLDLQSIAHQTTADLPFGLLRMIEVARTLVTGFRVVMLDEPASGLDNAETDKLIDVLRFVRGLGVTLLLIEHDVRMVTGVSDYLYVLDQGRIIAEGPPEDIQRNPEVIAAYLGEPVEEVTV